MKALAFILGPLLSSSSFAQSCVTSGACPQSTNPGPVIEQAVSAAFTFGTAFSVAEASNSNTAAYTATLPTCSAAIKNMPYSLVKVDNNTDPITLTASGTDMISGNPASSTVSVTVDGTSVQVKCDGNGLWLRGVQ